MSLSSELSSEPELRNIAIIAHVDHGKTTLVDQLLRQSGTFRDNQHVTERVMDSHSLERERGITILAKCTSVLWEDAEKDVPPTRINIIDTPGHADFGGEVERILSMVDGVVLLVDAAEGPMPQTKFVTTKALTLGLRVIVVINKVDRSDARVEEVHLEILDLFIELGASNEQLNFPVIYAAGRDGWASTSLSDPHRKEGGMKPLFQEIVHTFPQPKPRTTHALEKPFTLLVRMIESDAYLGRILTGRIESGIIRVGASVNVMRKDGGLVEKGRLTKVLAFRGIDRVPLEEAHAGDIVAIAGLQKATVADTICDASVQDIIEATPIDPPTLSITVSINDSPLAGKEGTKLQSRVIRERLLKEAEGNVSIRVTETNNKDAYEVAGRGELQLGILIENMRREGFELSVSRPRVLFQRDPQGGTLLEPLEEVFIDVDEEFTGVVIEALSTRRGDLIEMKPGEHGKTRLVFLCPSRGLIGYHGEFLTTTRGTGVMNRMFKGFVAHKGNLEGRRNGVLVSNEQGESVAYALNNLEERGELFIGPGEKVYQGMILGENSRAGDLIVNPCKAKQLTNMRASGKDDAVKLRPPRLITLEAAIAYIEDDELVEITPKSIRLRKRYLDPNERKRNANITTATH